MAIFNKTVKRTLSHIVKTLATGALVVGLGSCEKGEKGPCITDICEATPTQTPAYRMHRALPAGVLVPEEKPVIFPCTKEHPLAYDIGGVVKQTANISAGGCGLLQDALIAVASSVHGVIEITETTNPALLSRTIPYSIHAMDDQGKPTDFSHATYWHVDFGALLDAPENDALLQAIKNNDVQGTAHIGEHSIMLGDTVSIRTPTTLSPTKVRSYTALEEDAYLDGRMLSRDEAIAVAGADAVRAVMPGDTLELLGFWARKGIAHEEQVQIYDPCAENTFTSEMEETYLPFSSTQVHACTYLSGNAGVAVGASRENMITGVGAEQQALLGARAHLRAYPDAQTMPTGTLLIAPGSDNQARQFSVQLDAHQSGYNTAGTLPYALRNFRARMIAYFGGEKLDSKESMHFTVPADNIPTIQTAYPIAYDVDTELIKPRIATIQEIDTLKEHPYEH